ncbi:MAG: ATP-binding protein, partial [Ilumatobacteraceae bacterium]
MSPAPTIGRDEEHAMLLALVGEGRSVVVTGASGVGKTHVAREVMRAVDASGAATVWAAATRSGRDIPFGALASVLPSEVIAQISGSSTAELYLSIRRELERNPLSLPALICIDDAHLLDDASATLVHQLVTSGRVSMLLVVTSDTRAPEAITALWKEGAAARVELQPLSRQETDDLTVGLLDRACSPIALERIWATTPGNPL